MSDLKTGFKRSAMLGLIALGACGMANAATINWVDFSTWEAGTHDGGTGNPFSSSDGLTVDPLFTDTAGTIRPTYPKYLATTLDDGSWPFTNDLVPSVVTIGTIEGGNFATTLTMDFTNMGGLPIGGSVGIIDLELEGSSVTLTGYQFDGFVYNPVAVDWTPAFYQTTGVDVDPPMWDDATDTASGNANSFHPLINNFLFLVTDTQIDRLELAIVSEAQPGASPDPRSDGIAFAVSRQTVPSVPEPVTLLLMGSGLAGLAIRRRRGPAA